MKGRIITESMSTGNKNVIRSGKTTKNDIITNIMNNINTKISKRQMYPLLLSLFDHIFKTITNALKSGNVIEIRNFGTFEVVYKAGKINARNPKTGELVGNRDGFFAVRFRPGRILNELISSQEYEIKGENK